MRLGFSTYWPTNSLWSMTLTGLCTRDFPFWVKMVNSPASTSVGWYSPESSWGPGNPHQVAGPIHIYFHMGGAGTVLDAPVGVVAEDGHGVGRLGKVGEPIPVFLQIGLEILPKLPILQQLRHHGEEQGRAIHRSLAWAVYCSISSVFRS